MNPYFLAWLKAGGMCQPLYKYILWIQQKHREYRKIYDVKKDEVFYGFNQDEFIKFINIGPNMRQ